MFKNRDDRAGEAVQILLADRECGCQIDDIAVGPHEHPRPRQTGVTARASLTWLDDELLLAFAALRLFCQLFQIGLVLFGQGGGDWAIGRKNAFDEA